MKAPYEDFLHTLSSATDNLPGMTESITELPSKVAESITKIATFNAADWLTDLLLDWKVSAAVWLSTMTPYGLLALVGVWMARKAAWGVLAGRKERQDATWLRWALDGDVEATAKRLQAQGLQVKHGGGNILLVNAWDSGNVARALGMR